ncbi:MAG: DUF3857 domain-containing protein [Flavobacterium sp.]|uniref:DUF3857 domain-containing protein n=1 Tax=Flavobacterium sp. TaxID=239 RepID=UPI0012169EDA|nr:DUF3857 domain-containing protein [Flavobacterium sp.]RZJ65163.1 MAG: DUF3857 domain-containing protein [Flavobacterium sp.]
MILQNKSIQSFAVIALLFVSAVTKAQDFSFKNYNWEEKPTIAAIPDQYKNEKEVILERNTKVELQSAKGQATQYYLMHEKVLINSDDAVERNNKIYIPFRMSESVLTTKARVILKNGKVISLDSKDIKEETDEERGIKYNYFALNGLEKGAVIEKLYMLQESPELNGSTIRMQDEYPISKATFQLIYPDHLVFKTKSYNGLGDATIEEVSADKRKILNVSSENVPALDDDERYGNWSAAVKMFRYKLDANVANGAKNMYNFKEFSTNLYERFHPEYNKKEIKAIDDFIKQIPTSSNTQDQIWNVENKIKKTITYSQYIDSQEGINDIIKSRQANQSDILRLYFAVLDKMGIENQLVMTSERSKVPFDKDFESYENLHDILLYFPTIQKYLTPTEVEYRIPLFPSGLASNTGLFIKGKKFSGVNMGVGEIGFIEIPGTDITHDVMEITVDFSKDIANPTVTDKIAFGGYSAMNFQPVKDFASDDQYKELLKQIAKNYTVETEYKTLKTENDGTEFIGKKPFVLNVTFDGKDLVRKAGDNYLFSVGQVIGRQMELYQENKRVMPVEIDYPHSYTRTIKIILPEGAKVKNLEKFNMSYKTQLNGKEEAAFVSNYEQKGNVITVNNTEFYNVIRYPLPAFEEYRAVINAAADFNKIVIIVNK